jgi:hypothetical protein
LVAGPTGRARPDWGLDNTSTTDLVFEHACHRVQAALAQRFGLRDFFAVTTEWRPYWDALPTDALEDSEDPALPLARAAWLEARRPPFRDVLERALHATARLAEVARAVAPASSLWRSTEKLHASGFGPSSNPKLRCAECAWSREKKGKLACHQAERLGRKQLLIEPESSACELWEARLDRESCATCGACCREGFDRVELRARDGLRKKHPELVQEDRWGVFVPRPNGKCLALVGAGASPPYRCSVYPDRPRACAEFEIGSSACLLARRRAGVSP